MFAPATLTAALAAIYGYILPGICLDPRARVFDFNIVWLATRYSVSRPKYTLLAGLDVAPRQCLVALVALEHEQQRFLLCRPLRGRRRRIRRQHPQRSLPSASIWQRATSGKLPAVLKSPQRLHRHVASFGKRQQYASAVLGQLHGNVERWTHGIRCKAQSR